MADLKVKYKLILNQEEVDALKLFLGKFSVSKKTSEYGLTSRQSDVITEIFDCLPYSDDD